MRTHTITFTIKSKHPKEKILHELELTMNELIDKDEDLKIHAKKENRNTKAKGKNR